MAYSFPQPKETTTSVQTKYPNALKCSISRDGIRALWNEDVKRVGIGAYLLSYSKIRNINLPACTTIEGGNAFGYCGMSGEGVIAQFPACTSIAEYAFNKSVFGKIHFSAANESAIKALPGYSTKFGATYASFVFDL